MTQETVVQSAVQLTAQPGMHSAVPAAHLLARHEIVPLLIGSTVEEIERELVLQTLAHCDGNRTHAARVLGLSVRTLRNKIRLYTAEGIKVSPSKGASTSARPTNRMS